MTNVNSEITQTKATKENGAPRERQDERSNVVKRGGMEFKKPSYDYSENLSLDLSQEIMLFIKENDLHPRWVDEDKMPKMENLGYATVPQHQFKGQGQQLRRYVGKKRDGSPHYLVLMATPQEMFRERQEAKEKSIQEATIRQAQQGNPNMESGKEYVKEFTINKQKI